jgi:lysophospholipase L1-like esterase
VSTAGPDAGYGRLDLEAIDGAHSLEIRAEGDGPVTLYGAVLERDTPGVVLDMLGIPGARARSQLQWVRELRRDLLRERDPSLVVLAYGTNEAGDEDTLEGYVDGVRRVVGELRDDLPRAACLLVGPTDRPEKKGGKYLPRPRVQEITQRQRRLARELGCGFFDTQHFMGGPLSMRRWVRHRPQLGASDYVHLTPGGYEVLGAELFAALEHGYLTHGQRRRGK